jgi:hypothetical protein
MAEQRNTSRMASKFPDIELHGEMPYMMGEENRHAVRPQEARIIEETCIPAAGIQDATS